MTRSRMQSLMWLQRTETATSRLMAVAHALNRPAAHTTWQMGTWEGPVQRIGAAVRETCCQMAGGVAISAVHDHGRSLSAPECSAAKHL